MPFFSIIIPTFNAANTISACLESISRQDYTNYEVLIIDGLSSDTTLNIVENYHEKIPGLFILSEKDNGIYDAMNKGIELAKGEWLYFLGSDDRLNNESVLSLFFSINKLDSHVVYGNVKIIGNTTWAMNGDIYNGKFDLKKLFSTNICHQAIFYHRKCFIEKEEYFNTGYKVCSDWDFNLRNWAIKPFLYVDLLVADFYSGGISTVNNLDEVFFRDFQSNIVKYFGKKIYEENFLVNKQEDYFTRIKRRLKKLFDSANEIK